VREHTTLGVQAFKRPHTRVVLAQCHMCQHAARLHQRNACGQRRLACVVCILYDFQYLERAVDSAINSITAVSLLAAGAAPPLGFLYNMPTYVDAKLAANEQIYMNAGTHKELLGMKWVDYEGMAHPKVGAFACHAAKYCSV
jgi:hypothetical protein